MPPLDDVPRSFIPAEDMETDIDKERFNREIRHLRLKFEPENIRYLITERDDEIGQLIKHLDNVKLRFDSLTRQRLVSRILTSEQILKDI